MQIMDFLMIISAGVALFVGFLVVCKIRSLKAQFIQQHRQRFDELLNEIGEIGSLGEARVRAPKIVEIMRRYNATGLTLPLSSGGKVSFQLDSAASANAGDQ